MKSRTIGSVAGAAVAIAAAVVIICCRSVPIEAAYPVERAASLASRSVWTRVKGFFRGAEACAENRRLRVRAESLAMVMGDLLRLEEENARLRKALAYAERRSWRWLPAPVLSECGAAAGRAMTIRLGKGSDAGIRRGAVVAVPEGLVGMVTEVTAHTASVALLTDSSVQVACEVDGSADGRAFGIIAGGTEELLVIRHLSHGDAVSPRSRVVTSGKGGVFPKGIDVGVLQSVRSGIGGLASEAEVVPAVDFTALEDVFVSCER